MEDARIANLLESKLLFQPHRRSHFRSESYCTLVRIVSSFCKNADVSSAMDFDPQQLRAAYSSNLWQTTVESSGQQVGEDFIRPEIGDSAIEKVTVVEDGLVMKSLEDGCFHDSEVKMNVVEDTAIVGISDNVDDERELPAAAVSSQDNHCVHEESHRNKSDPEHMVEGNKVLVDDNSSNMMRTLDQTNCGNDQISPKTLQEKNVGHLKVMAEEDAMGTVQELFVAAFFLDGDKIREASKHKDNQEKMLPIVDNGVHQWTENRPKESKPEGIVCEPDLEIEESHVSSFEVMEVEHGEQCSGKVSAAELSYLDKEVPCRSYEQSKNSKDGPILKKVDTSEVEHKMPSEDIQMDKCLIENEDIEEGEIFGDSTCDISEHPAVLDEKVVDIQISEGTLDRNKLSSIKANGESKNPDSLFSNMVASIIEDQNDVMLEPEEAGYNVKDSEPKKDVDSFTACISNQVLHGKVLNECATGRNEIVSAEKETWAIKKKRGPLSEGRKEKKKVQKRKKRACVKRLKLPPITVPKPVVYCRHYSKGRCQQGDKCKFSHDTTPVTKSIPCSYFARHSCMKGDDCPFDHQLFKYPCTNFVSKGYCPRGDTCMFSHKILPQEQSSTPNLKTESKPPLVPDSLDSQKKSNISGGIKQKIVTVPNYAGASCNRTPLGGSLPKKTMGSPPIGISFLSFGKSPDHSSQVKNDDVECRNFLARSALCSVESSNENSRKIQSETTPKGMSFLSFDRTSLKFNSEKLAAPSSYNDATIPSSNQIQAVSETGHGSSELLKKVQTKTSKPTNFWSPIGNYTSNELLNSSSISKAGSDLSVPVKGSLNDKPEGLSAIYSRFLCTSFSPGQSSDSLASSMNKGTPNSAHNALLSTLAFAAKYELMNKGKPSDSAGSEGNKEDRNEHISGSLKNDQTKASKLLDFLLDVGSKSNLK